MKISKSSWHYKLNNNMKSNFTHMPNDICRYICLTLSNIFLLMGIMLIAFILILSTGTIWTDSICSYFQIDENNWLTIIYTFLAGIPTIVILSLLVFVIIYYGLMILSIIKKVFKKFLNKRNCKEIDYED